MTCWPKGDAWVRKVGEEGRTVQEDNRKRWGRHEPAGHFCVTFLSDYKLHVGVNVSEHGCLSLVLMHQSTLILQHTVGSGGLL